MPRFKNPVVVLLLTLRVFDKCVLLVSGLSSHLLKVFFFKRKTLCFWFILSVDSVELDIVRYSIRKGKVSMFDIKSKPLVTLPISRVTIAYNLMLGACSFRPIKP